MSLAGSKLGEELAFPCTPPLDPRGGSAPGYPYPETGLRKREYFAALAMQGLVASITGTEEQIAQWAVAHADALLKELAK